MGIKIAWQQQIIAALKPFAIQIQVINIDHYTILNCNNQVYINLVPLRNNFNPHDLLRLQEDYHQQERLLIHLWEDVWKLNPFGILSRIRSFLGLNQTRHARKSELVEIDAISASIFFNCYHLQGFVRAKFYYGLLVDSELMAMASFSDLRPMKTKGDNYTSAELIRFASKDGFTITGGLSKLIKNFLRLKKPTDLMSYADRDWSLGKGYQQLGFELTALTAPAYLFVERETNIRYFPHRLPKKVMAAFNTEKDLNLDDYLAVNGFEKIFNTGNLKYHLYSS